MRLTLRALNRATLLLVGVATALSCSGDSATPSLEPLPSEPIASVELSSTAVNVAPNTTLQLTATPRSSAGAALNGLTTWAVLHTSVATVSPSGLVTGVSEGTTTVTATADGKSASATVTVRTPVATVEVTPNPVQVVGNGRPSLQLTAIARSADGTTLEGRAVVWSSSNLARAGVYQTGVVMGASPGTAIITATIEGQSGTSVVTVVADPCSPVNLKRIAVGDIVSGAIDAGDCPLGDGSRIDPYGLTVTTPTLIEIEMTSSTVDPYLFISDVFGNFVAEDNDGVPGNRARVQHLFGPGTYLLLAGTFNLNSFGDYQLVVRLAPGARSTGRAMSLPGSPARLSLLPAHAASTSIRSSIISR